jgi:hypothetical protein
VLDIARVLHMNKRLVGALASQNARLYADFSERYAKELLADAAADFALAATKRDDANYAQLNLGGKLKVDAAIALKMIGAGGGEPAEAQDIEANNPALARALAFLEGRSVNVELETTAGHG